MRHESSSDALHRLTTTQEVEEIIGRPAAMILRKQVGALDEGCRRVLAYSPVAAFGYRDGSGATRTTFVGGAPGFARPHTPTRISFAVPEPDVARGPASLFFLLPGVGEVLRVNGTVAGRKGGETLVQVAEAYVHCAQAVMRSRLWQPPPPVPTAEPVVGEGPLAGPGVADFLAASPFLAVSSGDASGGGDTSPRGERGAVARIVDGRTLVMADRRGNRRADTLYNLLRDDRLSLAALVPGRSGVLHVRGRAVITDDAALLETLALRGVPPHLALVVDVEYAELAANAALANARLWSVAGRPPGGEAPDMMALGSAHLTAESPDSTGGSARLLRALTSIPGIHRLMRRVMDRAYGTALRKEGYQDVRPPTASRQGGTAPQDVTGGGLRPVRVVEVRQETATARTLVLEDQDPEEARPFDFRPGQFFTLVADVDGHPVRRAYSASSLPGATRLEVTVKQVEGGRFSSHVHGGLEVGDRLALRGPSGTFHAGDRTPPHLVLVAAGSGITPLMSLIRARLTDQGGRDRIALLYSSRSREDVIFADDLSRLEAEHPDRLSVTHVLTRSAGRLDAEGVRRWVTALSVSDGAHYYVCGPGPLMDTVREVVHALGVPEECLHQERFSHAPGAGAEATGPRRMRIEENGDLVGDAVVEPGQTLLDAGLAAGLPMPYSCTVGSCGECVVRLLSGEVSQAEPHCLTPEREAEGYVLTCVGGPLSRVTLDIGQPGAEG
ncbi:2Fe-2S iron-sulfur cluster-binding protein [Streptomyces sp. NPDC005438]|uniref:2Fe-2S iron-sulfur cluster-binding protein n=1 Tax=Streptomyces sp. NPDC005438 TaxID=3156880 RepID=UPI0033B85C95